ncbi:MAG TPA: tetratricopeptide repeat protein [Ktedonobacteraceae bacterium]|nr:tetratricopeptide repeat protein [Ktedonobacteraceae bacterium]
MPQAIDPRLCLQLAAERDFPRSMPPLPFYIGQACLQLDYLDIQNTSGKLCTEDFINVLERANVPFTAYSANLFEKDTKQPLPARYYFWIPQWIEGAIDWEQSEEWVYDETGVRRLTKIVLTSEYETKAPLLFQMKEGGYYLVHDKLRIQFQTADITGVAFAPVDTAYAPHEGIRIIELKHILEGHPDDWMRWIELGDRQVVVHRYQDALDSLDHALALKPDAEAAWYRRGSILHTLGRSQDALDALKRAIEIEPQSRAWNEYTAVLRKLGRHGEALASAEHAVQIWSRSSISWYELAAAYAALDQYEAALQAIERGLALGGGGPRLAEMYRIKGEALSQLGQYEEALSAYAAGLSCSPSLKALWAAKACVLHNLGRNEEASVAQQELDRLEQQREKNLQKRPM